MGESLAALHLVRAEAMPARTPDEVAAAVAAIDAGAELPAPFDRVSRETVRSHLLTMPEVDRPSVPTHGTPVVSAAVLVDGVVEWDRSDSPGFDPAERDLAIAVRSVAEAFSAEASRTFIDGYVGAGGQLPSMVLIDWYGLVAAFR